MRTYTGRLSLRFLVLCVLVFLTLAVAHAANPTVSSITPPSGPNGGNWDVTIVGTNLVVGATTAKLTKTGQSDIVATDVDVTGTTSMTCALDLTGATTGLWNLVVTTTGSVTKSNYFTVYDAAVPAPTLTGVTPLSGLNNDSTVSITNLAGTGFITGATVKLTKAGETDIVATNVAVPSATRITCSVNLLGAAAGPWNVVVTNTDGQSGTLTGGFTVANPAPVVTAMTPNSGINNGSVNITNLTGSNFLTGATVKLTKSGETDIAATGVTVVSPTQITCTLDLTGKAAGAWAVVVTNYDGKSDNLNSAFTIVAPKLTSITPAAGLNSGSVSITNLAGTGFAAGATVRLQKIGETPIDATGVTVVTASKITCDFDLTGAAIGAWDVAVTNTNGGFSILPDGFTVSNPTPTVTGITPGGSLNSGSVSITDLAGTGFLPGATVTLTKSGQTAITATGVSVVSPTQITCALDLTGAATGAWNVVVTNSDAKFGTLASGFSIANPAPTVASITPDNGLNNGSVSITSLVGTGFMSGATVKLQRAGQTDLSATSVTVVGSTLITCSFNLSGKAAGVWDVLVTNADTQSATLPDGFTIAYPAPTVTGITPGAGLNSGTISITNLAGTGFLAGATVELQKAGQTPIAATGINVVGPLKITCSLDLTGAQTGAWDVVVTNPDGESGSRVEGFEISYPAPDVTGITPASRANDGSVNITDLTGSGFLPGATVKLTKTGQPEIAATGVAVLSPTQITCTLDLTGQATGLWNVVVTNPDAQTDTLSGGFDVNLPPTVTSVTPSLGVNDGSVNITNLAGTNFAVGATVKLQQAGKPDIIATAVTRPSGSKITCSFDLTGASSGAWDVTVTNVDQGVGTLSGGFTIYDYPAPSITSISPNNAGSNNASVNISSLAGTGFRPGAAVKLQKAGQSAIAATNLVISPTQITCSLDLTDAVTGTWDVVVTNTDGQSATKAGAFTVNAAPQVTSLTPGSGVNNNPACSITNLAGSGFVAGATVRLERLGQTPIAATNVTRASGSKITCSLNLMDATPGAWDVVVTNLDGGVGGKAAAFTVANAPLTVTTVTPNTGVKNTSVTISGLTGTGFLPGATVELQRSGETSITATSVVRVSATEITCAVDLTDALPGVWDVVVTNPDTLTGTLAGGFTVLGVPTTVMTSPTAGKRNDTVELAAVLTSAGSPVPGKTLTFTIDGNAFANNTAVTDGTGRAALDYTIPASLALGARTIRAAFAADTTYASAQHEATLTVEDSPPTKPASVSITPAAPLTTNDLTAVPDGSMDPDGHTLSYEYKWYFLDGGTWKEAGVEDSTVEARHTAKGEQWKVEARASAGGLYSAWLMSDPVTIGDTTPTAPAVSVSPEAPLTTDDLTGSASGADDADGDSISYQYKWYKKTGGADWTDAGVTETTVPSSDTAKGEQWKLAARAVADGVAGPWAESSPVTIADTAPTAPDVSVSPEAPLTSDDLMGRASGSDDIDGDAVSYEYKWYKKNGADWLDSGLTGTTVPSNETAKDEQWKLAARAVADGMEGPWAESAPVTIGDTGPTVPNVSVSPDAPGSSDDLAGSADGAEDADGDSITYEFNWFRMEGGEWVDAGINTATLTAGQTTKGEQWKVRVRAVAGGLQSDWAWSDPVTIGDTAPTVPTSIGITPAIPYATDDLVAVAVGSTDSDGDTVDYEYKWYKWDGASWTDAGISTSTVEHTLITKGDRWRVEVRSLADGVYSEPALSTAVVVRNSIPTAPVQVSLRPANPRPGQSVTALASGSTDADEDAITYRYAWETSSDGDTWTAGPLGRVLSGEALVRGVYWRCKVRAHDGAAVSAWTTGQELIVGDGAPTAPTSVSITPVNPTVSRNLIAAASGATDPEDDALTYRYQWWQSTDGGSNWTTATAGRILNKSLLVSGHMWKVAARANDGTISGPWTESEPVTIGGAAATVAATAVASGTRAGAVQITVSLTAAAAVTVRIMNMAGYEIAVLNPQSLDAGISTVSWNGRSSKGTRVPRGHYVAQLQVCSPDGTTTRCSAPVVW